MASSGLKLIHHDGSQEMLVYNEIEKAHMDCNTGRGESCAITVFSKDGKMYRTDGFEDIHELEDLRNKINAKVGYEYPKFDR